MYCVQIYIEAIAILQSMSFFDNTKIAGWAFFIIGILMIISAIMDIWNGAGATGSLSDNAGYVVAGIGSLIAAILYFLFGNKVRNGTISAKIDVLGNYVRIVGVTTVIINLFALIGYAVVGETALATFVVWIILGIIIAWIGGKVNDGKTTNFDKILWIILLIIFVILFIGSLLGIGGDVVDIVKAICYAIVYLFMIIFMFDEDVRKKMGI